MLASTTTSMLRAGVARPSMQPALLLRRSQVCPYSTIKAAAPLSICRNSSSSRPQPARTTPKASPSAALVRKISTTPSPARPAATDHDADAAAAAQVAAQSARGHATEPPLDWNTFFRLRKSRRRWQLLFSVASSLAAGTGGALLLTTGAADALVSQVPLDPMITLGLMVFASAALGWLVGPSLGSQVFYAINRKYQNQMTVKEVQFFARIKKNRVDPSNSSAGNPGEFLMATTRSSGVVGILLTGVFTCSSRLLRREDLECGWLPAVAEGSAGFQQEADDVRMRAGWSVDGGCERPWGGGRGFDAESGSKSRPGPVLGSVGQPAQKGDILFLEMAMVSVSCLRFLHLVTAALPRTLPLTVP